MSAELERRHKDYTVNRCIVTMLVVLATTTGVEAQVYHSALKLALSDISKDGVMAPTEAKAIENDIKSIIRVVKKTQDNNAHAQHLNKDAFFTRESGISSHPDRSFHLETESICEKTKQIIYDSIIIRGPDKSSFL